MTRDEEAKSRCTLGKDCFRNLADAEECTCGFKKVLTIRHLRSKDDIEKARQDVQDFEQAKQHIEKDLKGFGFLEALEAIDEITRKEGEECFACKGIGGKRVTAPGLIGWQSCKECDGKGKWWYGIREVRPGIVVSKAMDDSIVIFVDQKEEQTQ